MEIPGKGRNLQRPEPRTLRKTVEQSPGGLEKRVGQTVWNFMSLVKKLCFSALLRNRGRTTSAKPRSPISPSQEALRSLYREEEHCTGLLGCGHEPLQGISGLLGMTGTGKIDGSL